VIVDKRGAARIDTSSRLEGGESFASRPEIRSALRGTVASGTRYSKTLDERLLAGGYCESNKTLFIWQGVTMYLTPEGVDNTLSFIANHSGPGSTVIFDYFYNETLHDSDHNEMKHTDRILQATGERLCFGIDQGQTEPFLAQRGFCDIRNATSEDLKELYFTGPNAGRKILTGCAIVSARVKTVSEGSHNQ
jgi:methyltransferase (TIGR00027 family)